MRLFHVGKRISRISRISWLNLYFFRGELIERNCRSKPNFLALGTSDVGGFLVFGYYCAKC